MDVSIAFCHRVSAASGQISGISMLRSSFEGAGAQNAHHTSSRRSEASVDSVLLPAAEFFVRVQSPNCEAFRSRFVNSPLFRGSTCVAHCQP